MTNQGEPTMSTECEDDLERRGVETVTLSVTVPADQLPAIGETLTVRLSNGMSATVENLGDSNSVRDLATKRTESRTESRTETRKPAPRTLNYAAVNTTDHASEVRHAAIVRRVNNRNRVERFTICDRRGKRIVASLLHKPLEAVTCKQCRTQLIEDGVLEPTSDD